MGRLAQTLARIVNLSATLTFATLSPQSSNTPYDRDPLSRKVQMQHPKARRAKFAAGRPSSGGRRTITVHASLYRASQGRRLATRGSGAGCYALPDHLGPRSQLGLHWRSGMRAGVSAVPSRTSARSDLGLPLSARLWHPEQVWCVLAKYQANQPALLANHSLNRTLHSLPAFGLKKPSPNAANLFRAG